MFDAALGSVMKKGGGGSGASTALDNLASVAINTSLISDTDNTDDLGSASKGWKDLYLSGKAYFADGAVAAPSITFESDTDLGFWRIGANQLIIQSGAGNYIGVDAGDLFVNAGKVIGWGAASNPIATKQTSMYEKSAGVVGFGGATTTAAGGIQPAQSANGANIQILSLSELTTIAAAATTDTTIEIPANSIACVVTGRVTVLIPTAATFDVGIAGATTRYATGIAVAAGTTFPGSIDGWRYYAAATKIRYTPNLTPGDTTGRVRTTIFYITPTAPTS